MIRTMTFVRTGSLDFTIHCFFQFRDLFFLKLVGQPSIFNSRKTTSCALLSAMLIDWILSTASHKFFPFLVPSGIFLHLTPIPFPFRFRATSSTQYNYTTSSATGQKNFEATLTIIALSARSSGKWFTYMLGHPDPIHKK